MAEPSPKLHVVDHPLVAHLLARLRDRDTPCEIFRGLLAKVGELIAYEATRDLATEPVAIQTPLEAHEGRILRSPLTIVPILRAGLGMAHGILGAFPFARIGHIGMFRDEVRLVPVTYYEKLPADVAQGPVLLVDPMLATGGSATASVKRLHAHGCRDIRMICLIAAPEGIQAMRNACPEVPIWTAGVDRQLNEVGYILPGLGDAGDRQFGTL